MLRWLSRRLILSADARNLAVTIAEKHGCGALEFIDAALTATDLCPADRETLTIARREIVKLMPLLKDRRDGPK